MLGHGRVQESWVLKTPLSSMCSTCHRRRCRHTQHPTRLLGVHVVTELSLPRERRNRRSLQVPRMYSGSKSLHHHTTYLDLAGCVLRLFTCSAGGAPQFPFSALKQVFPIVRISIPGIITSIFIMRCIFNCSIHLSHRQVLPEYLLCARPCGRCGDLMVSQR